MRFFSIGLLLGGLALLSGSPATPAADDFKPEAGFTVIFNGTDLTGWKVRPDKKDKDGPALDGKKDAVNGRFKVENAAIVIDAKSKGNVVIDTAKSYGKDVTIKFEYNPGPGCNNDLYFRGAKFDIKAADIKNMKENEWNTLELIVTGDKLEIKNNGEAIKTFKATADATPLGIPGAESARASIAAFV